MYVLLAFFEMKAANMFGTVSKEAPVDCPRYSIIDFSLAAGEDAITASYWSNGRS